MPTAEYIDSNTEQDLIARLIAGDEAAYKAIYEQYALAMFQNALRFTKSTERARDLTQEIFLKIWMHRARLATVEHFGAYLYIVARNTIFSELKKQLPLQAMDPFLESYLLLEHENAQEITEYKELEAHLHAAINALPAQMQAVFKLSRYEGLTHDQIAAKMAISPITSKSYIVRALIAIRASLDENGVPYALIFLLLY